MRNYAISIRITLTITLISFVGVMIVHYGFCGKEPEFWVNVLLAIFGSGLLTAISSFIGYFYEKRRSMESFWYSSRNFLSYLNKYDSDWAIEKKIDFYLDYLNCDKSSWDMQLGSIFFLHDPHRKKFKYVYHKIYSPLSKLNELIGNHGLHFMSFKSSNWKNEEVMKRFINEIESYFLEINTIELEDGNNKVPFTEIKPKLTRQIYDELSGYYYILMYGKRIAERNTDNE